MIKKILLFTLLLLINPTFCQQQDTVMRGRYQIPLKQIDTPVASNSSAEPTVIQNSGFYWVIVKRMPSLWTFWKCWKPVRIMAEYAKKSTQEIWNTLESEIPVLMTFDLKEAQSLQAELLALGCELEIHEVGLSFSSPEGAEYFKKRQAEKCTQETKI